MEMSTGPEGMKVANVRWGAGPELVGQVVAVGSMWDGVIEDCSGLQGLSPPLVAKFGVV